ncbi:MAG: hypothetical protein HY822_20765 [Acidobacteria bacterium]|nr:hypothetical protein [Acidobacteriota bacterium]
MQKAAEAMMRVKNAPGVSFRRQWKPASDVTSVRVIVPDTGTGPYGTLDIPVNGPR